MPPRVTKAFGKRSGTRVSRGRGSVQTREENLRQIVGQLPISDAHQELLDEEGAEGGSDDIVDLAEYEITSASAEPLPPPDWRWAAKKKGNGHQVWARCNTGKWKTKNKQHYYSEYSKYEKRSSGIDSSQPTLNRFQQFCSTTMTKERQKKLDIDLGYSIAIDNIPLNILRRKRFRRWIHSGMPGYQLPGIERMRNGIIPSLVHATRCKLLKIIKDSSSFTIILDIWSSKSMMGFIGFTCHAVTKTFERYILFLGVKRMIGRHTAENILAEYEHLLRDWEIDRSLIVMVKTDGGSNMVANTFMNDIPGWHNEDEFSANDHQSDYVPAQPSTSTSSPSELDILAAETTQSMAEIEIADATEGDPLWVLLQELGFNFSETELNDEDDVSEFRDLERDLEEHLPSTESTFEPLDDDYILYSRLRSDCVAHKLQLVIKDGFKTLSDEAAGVISHVSKIVNSARKSVNDSDLIYNLVGFRLSKKNSTRWNSTLYELQNFLKAIQTDTALLTRLMAVKKHGTLTAYQQIVLKEIVAILKPFEAASNDFQADFETVGNVIPAYLGLMNALTLTVRDRNGVQIPNPNSRLTTLVKFCKGFVAGLRLSLERRFLFILRDVHYVMGSIFDPRFKLAWITLAGLNETAVVKAVAAEIELRYHILRTRKVDSVCLPNPQTQVQTDDACVSPPNNLAGPPSSTRKRRLSQSLYSPVIEVPRPRSVIGPAKALEEFDVYLKEDIIDMEVPLDPMDPNSELCVTKPLEFWKVNQYRFPILSEIGRDVVSVAASSGSVERAFSVASDILTAKRSAMKPDLFSNLMLIKCNAGLNVGSFDE
ncbi:uncharacterized protein LOC116933634 isoform X4 [Daphnia magna]|uniref:uncharacterized protein LOC116933634 isoform X4 n=1 Tax=Daphnia magna TaxID=35525 RepID=UPI001E1BD87C|nr:uncharacterized protein LOC116933634 isoform X4 [Daphnia magna]